MNIWCALCVFMAIAASHSEDPGAGTLLFMILAWFVSDGEE